MNKLVRESLSDHLSGPSKENIMSKLKNEAPNSALIKSAENGFLPGVKRALEQGADIHANDNQSLRIASVNGHLNIVKYLNEQGADIHAANDYTLYWASKNGHTDVVNYLKSQMNKENE